MDTPKLKVPKNTGIKDRELPPTVPESTKLLKEADARTGLGGGKTGWV